MINVIDIQQIFTIQKQRVSVAMVTDPATSDMYPIVGVVVYDVAGVKASFKAV